MTNNKKKGRILVADDEASLRLLLENELKRSGYDVDVVENGKLALDLLRHQHYHVVLLDIVMPKMDGITVLKHIKAEEIPTEIIILTGNASIESAIECMRIGAFEYIKKPYSLNELLIHIERAIERQSACLDVLLLKEDLKKSGNSGNLIGKSDVMLNLAKIISRVASTHSTVLILGESGSGKEVVARKIHQESDRKDNPFVVINCASLSEALLESELFGYEKGAFTDAKNQKRGLSEMADGGILFLDEIGEIPIRFQAKLLRFLETGEIRRVGGTMDIALNVRIICATNKPLEYLVAQNKFRKDLYYRLNVLTVNVPPLRDRSSDIPHLVEFMLSGQAFAKLFEPRAITLLKQYEWPGNVRELKNVIERSCVLSNGKSVTVADLSFLRASIPIDKPHEDIVKSIDHKENEISITSLKEMERKHIVNILKYVDGHKGRAAEILKINPKTLYYKMRSYAIVTDFK